MMCARLLNDENFLNKLFLAKMIYACLNSYCNAGWINYISLVGYVSAFGQKLFSLLAKSSAVFLEHLAQSPQQLDN